MWSVRVVAVLAFPAVLAGNVLAATPEYPNKAIRFIAASLPGGASDLIARTVSIPLSEGLGVQRRHQLGLGGGPAHTRVRRVFIHKRVELMPRDVLQKPVQDAIVVTHGVGPFSCPNHRQVFEFE